MESDYTLRREVVSHLKSVRRDQAAVLKEAIVPYYSSRRIWRTKPALLCHPRLEVKM